jgi:tRNA pseudouridine55 synthase
VTPEWEGLLLVDKPAGPTSHDIVARLRRQIPGVRIGHTGTLDPPATGLLALMLGGATRLARFLPAAPKCYEGELVLGLVTTTDDLEGDVTQRHEGPWPLAEDMYGSASRQVGRHQQVPPSVSAKHIEGRRAYVLARRGKPVVPRASEVEVTSFDVSPTAHPDRWRYSLTVSAGTYVRACIRDLGTALGCGACVASLRRTRIGPWHVKHAMAWDAPDFVAAARSALVRLDELPLGLDRVVLEHPEARRRFLAGATTPCPPAFSPTVPAVAVHSASGEFLGIGVVEASVLRASVVVAPAARNPVRGRLAAIGSTVIGSSGLDSSDPSDPTQSGPLAPDDGFGGERS